MKVMTNNSTIAAVIPAYQEEKHVGEVAERRHRPEGGRQRQNLAARRLDPRPHAPVGLDVGSSEPVDRLLGVADDEERAGAEADARPVGR